MNQLPIEPKLGVIIYHSNIYSIFKQRWVEKCLESIKKQSVQEYEVFELCYSAEKEQLWENSIYEHFPMLNHIEAMNHLLDKAFMGHNCDIVFNVNLDDFYPLNRFKAQRDFLVNNPDALICSSDFQLIHDRQDGKNNPQPRHMIFESHDHEDDYYQVKRMSALNLREELKNKHNIVCHPSVAYTKRFWEIFRYYDVKSIGKEDMVKWREVVENGVDIPIIPKVLCYHRISDKQTGRMHSSHS